MDNILTIEIVKSFIEGDTTRVLGYIAIFFFIWKEVKGLKGEVSNLNKTIAKSFAQGEARFEILEGKSSDYESRITRLETLIKT